METLARRGVLKLLLGVGAAAACGMSAAGPAEAEAVTLDGAAAPVGPDEVGTDAATEVVEPALEPDQFYFRRRRRYRRRRVFYFRPRRRRYRVVRFYRVRRRRRRFF